jgi:hypothetical protein
VKNPESRTSARLASLAAIATHSLVPNRPWDFPPHQGSSRRKGLRAFCCPYQAQGVKGILLPLPHVAPVR